MEYQMNRKSDARSFKVVHVVDSNTYDIEYVDTPGEISFGENITFDSTIGATRLAHCELSVQDFHQWMCDEEVFEQLFGSHLHAQLLANQGCEFEQERARFVIYMSKNGLLTGARAEWMVNEVCC